MRNFLILIVVGLIVAGGYGYNKNPKAWQKLGHDLSDFVTMGLVPSDSSKTEVPQPQNDPMAGNVLRNGDFSSGASPWTGDGVVVPNVKGLVVPLSSGSWTKIAQDFKGDKGTYDTLTVTYKVSPDLWVSSNAADYDDVGNHIRFEDYEGFGSVTLPTGDFLVWIGDLTHRASRYERYPVKPDSGDTQTISHKFPQSLPFANKMVTIAFPPGTGSVTILSVSVTSDNSALN